MQYALFFFFFQAEDGIRDLTVTGVQTCALPISRRGVAPRAAGPGRRGEGKGRVPRRSPGKLHPELHARLSVRSAGFTSKRSEERRVGKECRSRGSPYH